MKICDCHNDFLTEIKINNLKINYIKDINKDKNIKYICSQIWTTKYKNPIKEISKIQDNVLNKINSRKIILCIEDLGFINRNNFNYCLEKIKSIKPFSCGLVWNLDNTLGGGAFGKKGLTKLGKNIIIELESCGIFIDTAHMNKQTFFDFMKITTKPIYNSHTNINLLYKHERNLNNKQLKSCINSNGLIGLSFVKSFINDKSINSYNIAKQIEFFILNFGCKNISIGSDFFGTKNLPIDLKSYKDFNALKIRLKTLHISPKIINKILYKNFLKFYKKYNKF